MDAVFHAGVELGRAEILRLDRKNGAAHLSRAAADLNRAGIPALRNEASTVMAVSRNWKARAAEIPQIIARIQALGGRTYQAISAGVLLGLAIEACRLAGKDTDTATAKTQLLDWLNGAKAHTRALKDQGLVPSMPNFDSRFNSVITPIQLIKQASELPNHSQLIENLSNQVGNAIR